MCWPDRDGGLAALAPLCGANASAAAAPTRPGGQWRPGFGRESSGRPGRHPPLDGCRFAEPPTALPGGERRLGTVHETNGGPSRSPPGPRAFCGRPAPSGQVGPHGGTSPPMCPPALRGGNQFAQWSGANCEPAGATPPPVNLWPLSFDQESGNLGPGRCLTISQTTALPIAQPKKES